MHALLGYKVLSYKQLKLTEIDFLEQQWQWNAQAVSEVIDEMSLQMV